MSSWRSARIRSVFAAILVTAILAAVVQQTAAADEAPLSATVTVTERGGFNPPNVFIQRGGTVTWKNIGFDSHDVETGSAPIQFVLSMSPGQSKSWRFVRSGVYHYRAGTDCIWGQKALFPCLDYSVIVLDPGQAVPTPAVTPTPTPQVATVTVQQDASLQISDTGFVQRVAAITVGGTVSWINTGVNLHTATSTLSPTNFTFDTGGLGTSQFSSVTINDPGLYRYTSSADCLHGNQQPGFDCRPVYLVVTTSPPGTSLPIPAAAAASSTPTPNTIGGVPLAADTLITVDDANGFSPRALTIKLGQTVTWLNKGAHVHSMVTDLGVNPSFNSGGVGPAQQWAWLPLDPGVFAYHSSTDAWQQLSPTCRCSLYRATITVGQ